MQVVSVCIGLHPVERAHELQMCPSFSEFFTDNFGIHFLVIHAVIPNAEGGARRGSNDPHGF